MEVRSLQNPPAGVKLVMEAACIMFDEKPKMKDDPNKMGKHSQSGMSAAECCTTPAADIKPVFGF